MKIFCFVVLALAAMDHAVAFMQPFPLRANTMINRQTCYLAALSDTDTDISVPYDAAARLAYDKWRSQFKKGDFDEKRYEVFRANYETITIANVAAKKRAREDGTVSLSLMILNEFGDLSEKEYTEQVQKLKQSEITTKGDVLSKAVENAELQSRASTALGEAADALADEEKKLAEQLGLNSVEELEIVLDSLEGIAPDGGELDTDNIAREARIREAYLKWCKEFKEQTDESRFPVFSNNFLILEQYAKESVKEMNLNQYADCTKEEYEAMQSGSKAVAASPAKSPLAEKSEPSPFEIALEMAAKAAQGASEKAAEVAGRAIEFTKNIESFDLEATDNETPEAREARLKARAEAAAKADVVATEAREKKLQRAVEREKLDEERRQLLAQRKAEREKVLAKQAEQAKVQAEKEAIASAKAAAEREATLAAQLSYFEKQADEEARKQAAESEAKLRRMKANVSVQMKATKSPFNFFSSKPTSDKKQRAAEVSPLASLFSSLEKPSKAKSTQIKKIPAIKKSSTSSFSFFSAPTPQKMKKNISAPKPAPSSVAKNPSPDRNFFSFLTSPARKSSPAPTPATVKSTPSISFSLFGESPKKTKTPARKPTPVSKAQSTASFSIFGAPSPKLSPAPTKVKASTSFSIFGPPSEKKANTPSFAPSPKAKPTGWSNFFGSSSEKKPKEIKIPNQRGTINILGTQSVAPSKAAAKKRVVSVPNRLGTISLFSAGQKQAPEIKAKKEPIPVGVPVLSGWKQNSDGTITGKVANAKGFRNGAVITTSPVRKGVKARSVVKTGSGSKYYLS